MNQEVMNLFSPQVPAQVFDQIRRPVRLRGGDRFVRYDARGDVGHDARRIAGGMSAKGEALILLPKASVDRLLAQNAVAQP